MYASCPVTDPGVEIGGHIGPYNKRIARAYNGGMGLCPSGVQG